MWIRWTFRPSPTCRFGGSCRTGGCHSDFFWSDGGQCIMKCRHQSRSPTTWVYSQQCRPGHYGTHTHTQAHTLLLVLYLTTKEVQRINGTERSFTLAITRRLQRRLCQCRCDGITVGTSNIYSFDEVRSLVAIVEQQSHRYTMRNGTQKTFVVFRVSDPVTGTTVKGTKRYEVTVSMRRNKRRTQIIILIRTLFYY